MEEEKVIKDILKEKQFQVIQKLSDTGFGHIYQVKKDNIIHKVKIIKREKGNELNSKEYNFKQIIGEDIYYGTIIEKKEGILFEILNKNKFDMVKKLGEGGFGLAYQVKKDGKNYAAKLLECDREEKENEADIIKEFRGQNIVKVNKVLNGKDIGYDNYYVIIMEEAPLKSLKDLIINLKKNNQLNLLYNSPFEIIGNNLLKYFISQLIQGLEILKRNNFCHFDIKPDNILIFYNFYVKWADFGLLRDIETIQCKNNNNNDKMIHVPGGTHGYFSPEFFQQNKNIHLKDAFKHDYFSLGATIYFIKYGKTMLNYINGDDKLMTSNTILELIEKKIDEIKPDKSSDKGFTDFLYDLIQYKPEQRPNLELLLRNQWLNKNKEEIEEITEINYFDEKKLLLEIDKSDFLIKKKEYLDPIIEKKNDKNKNRKNKFVFKKAKNLNL